VSEPGWRVARFYERELHSKRRRRDVGAFWHTEAFPNLLSPEEAMNTAIDVLRGAHWRKGLCKADIIVLLERGKSYSKKSGWVLQQVEKLDDDYEELFSKCQSEAHLFYGLSEYPARVDFENFIPWEVQEKLYLSYFVFTGTNYEDYSDLDEQEGMNWDFEDDFLSKVEGKNEEKKSICFLILFL
jgi:hypothetical protein